MKSGFVSIVGRPNVGKSTLINAICGHTISIVSPKAQTTRDVIRGIYNEPDCQIVFVDTPGFHKAVHKLGTIMNNSAIEATKEVDAVVWMVDASKRFGDLDETLSEYLKKEKNLFIVLNKIDLCRITEVENIKNVYKEKFPNATYIEMSAIENFNIDELVKQIKNVLEEGPKYFDDDTISDHDDVFMMKEVIREHILLKIREEVPHKCAVYVEQFKNDPKELHINAVIVVDKVSQKGIIIGKGGKMIKAIGTGARKELEDIFKKHIYLEIFVKVREDWVNSNINLKEFGYK